MFEQFKLDEIPSQATKLVKDSAYFTVGLVVLAVQRTQTQWNDLRKQLESQLDAGKDQVSTFTDRVEPQLKAIDERMTALEARWEELLTEVGGRLPEPAGKALDRAFEAAKSARAQMRGLVLGADETKAA